MKKTPGLKVNHLFTKTYFAFFQTAIFIFAASRKLLLKKRTALLKQVDQKPDSQDEILNSRRKIDKETKRAAGYIDEKIILTEKLSKMIGTYNRMLEEALSTISSDDPNGDLYGYGSDYKGISAFFAFL